MQNVAFNKMKETPFSFYFPDKKKKEKQRKLNRYYCQGCGTQTGASKGGNNGKPTDSMKISVQISMQVAVRCRGGSTI